MIGALWKNTFLKSWNEMKLNMIRKWGVLALTIIATKVSAFTPDKSAEKTIEESIIAIVALIQQYPTDADRGHYLAGMETLMDQLVSYPVIARRVMGDAFVVANDQQKVKFLGALKASLIQTYAMGIRGFGGFDAKVLYGKGEQNTLKNTQVLAEIMSKEGIKYPMMQSLYYSRNANGWLIQNIVFNGVNLGITFQNQFKRNLDSVNGDIDQAIAIWAASTEEAYTKADFRNPSEDLLLESATGEGF